MDYIEVGILADGLEVMLHEAEKIGSGFVETSLSTEELREIVKALRTARAMKAPLETVGGTPKKSTREELFKREYADVKRRYEEIKRSNTVSEAEELRGNAVILSREKAENKLMRDQQRTMGEYLHILELRAVINEIDLFGEEA